MINQPLPLKALEHFAQANPDAAHAPTALIIGLAGWNDAGEVISDALRALQAHYKAQPIQGLTSDHYYDYTVTRPHLAQDPTGATSVLWPSLDLTEATTTAGHRLLTLTGPEPSLHWHALAQELTALIEHEHVDLVLLCGALLDEVPHTRTFPLTLTSWEPQTLALEGVSPSTYTGPTGLIGVLAEHLGRNSIPSLSLWISIPHYLPEPPHPKGSFTVLGTLEAILGTPLPLERFADEILNWEREASDLLEDEPELASYVRTLESSAEAKDDIADLSQIDIAAEFEKFLKDQGPDDKAPDPTNT